MCVCVHAYMHVHLVCAHMYKSLPLLPLSQTFASSQLKVGVLNVKKGQTCEAEIFGNLHEPGHFRKFLEMLGECTSQKCYEVRMVKWGLLSWLLHER